MNGPNNKRTTKNFEDHICEFSLVLRSILLIYIMSLLLVGSSSAADNNQARLGTNKVLLEQQESMPEQPLVRMRDSQTGYAVFPDDIVIIDTTTNKTVYHKTCTREQAMKEFKGGVFPAMPDLPTGSYKYIIQADGYKPISSYFFTGSKNHEQGKQKKRESQLKKITFFLDPIETPPELKYEALKPLSRPDSSVLVGLVVDDETGLPVRDALVRTEDGKILTKTNERGFFVIRFPFPAEYEEFTKINVIYEKEGYRS